MRAHPLLLLVPMLVSAATVGGAEPDGRGLYETHCAACHGDTGRGDGPEAWLLTDKPRDLKDGVLDRYDDDDLVARILAGMPLALELDPAALRRRMADVDDLIAHMEAMPDVNWKVVERGEEIYVDRCEFCHGPYGQPPIAFRKAEHPPQDLSSPAFQRGRRDEDLIRVVRRGHETMSAVPGIRDDRSAQALVAYLRVLSPGFTLYSMYCAGCHGDDGTPQTQFVEPKRRPHVVLDRAYLEGRNPDQMRAAAAHMLGEQRPTMPHFRGRLSAAEARAIVHHLRRLAPSALPTPED